MGLPQGIDVIGADPKLLREWFDKNWSREKKCLICGSCQWNIDCILEIRPYRLGSLVVGGPIYPFIPVICMTCGFTIFINAKRAGFIP